MRAVRVLKGGSPEYDEDGTGRNPVVPPPESLSVHRFGASLHPFNRDDVLRRMIQEGTGTWHRETSLKSKDRLAMQIDSSPLE